MEPRRRGFTLIESAVAAAIFAIVFSGAIYIFTQAPRDEMKMSAKVSMFQKARQAYFDMTEELKLGTEILQPPVNGTTPFILFTNVTYEIVGYYLRPDAKDTNPDPTKRRKELVRVNFNEKDAKPIVLCDNATVLRFTRKGRREAAIRFEFEDEKKNLLPLVNSITVRNTLSAY